MKVLELGDATKYKGVGESPLLDGGVGNAAISVN